MAIKACYPHGFSDGVAIREVPMDVRQNKLSKTFWVDSVNGSNGNNGSVNYPFATIAYALTRCSSSVENGDKIYVAPKHVEPIIAAGTLTIAVNGVTIIFLGEGDNQAQLNFSTATTASMIVTGHNVTLIRPCGVAGIDNLSSPITISGRDFKIRDGVWYDAAGKAAVHCIVIGAATIRPVIDGWKYFGSTAGTQKVAHIEADGTSELQLRNIDIDGSFSTGNILLSNTNTNVKIEHVYIRNRHAAPHPGLVEDATTTGIAKNLDVRISSGVVYVSNLAAMNWDDMCLGYNADGQGGDPIGGGAAGSVEAKIDAIQTDIGDPSASATSLEGLIRTGYNSAAIVSNANGSVMEQLKAIAASLATPQSDLFKAGNCDAGMVASATNIVSADFIGKGDDYYNLKYYLLVVRNDNSHGNAPELQYRQITDYTSLTGTFVTNAFGANVEAADEIAVIHESLVAGTNAAGTVINTINTNVNTVNTNIGDPSAHALTTLTAKIGNNATTIAADFTTVKAEVAKIDSATLAVAPVAGSLARFIASGGTALGTPLADSKSLVNALGTDGTTAAVATAASAVSLFGAIGTNEADATTPFSSSNVQANADGTVLEREEYIQGQVNKVDSATLAVNPTAGSLARFVASGGTALGTALGDSKSLVDALGTNGVAAAAATCASAVSLFGAIGTNEADAATPFTSANVQANVDGTVLEREEYIQTQVDKIDAVTLAVNPAAGSLARFVASGGTALGTALADSKSLVDAVGSNGTTLVYGSGSILGAIGTVFWIKKTMTSSAIVSGAPVDITGVSSGGELAVEDVIVKTDGTGLAGGTNFELKTNNAKGQLNFFVETVANLGASATVDLGAASVTQDETVLESGKKFQVQSTVLDCSGGGTIDIYIKLRRLSAGATISPL